MFTLRMNMKSKGESPRERPRPRPRQKLLRFANEVTPFLGSCPSSPRLRMDPTCDTTKGNVDMHFEKIAIEVDRAGHYLFQEVSNGIKADDQSVTRKKTREAIVFLTNVQFDLERKMEPYQEGCVIVTYYAIAIDKCLSYTGRWEKLL
jgi:hypothetical protein